MVHIRLKLVRAGREAELLEQGWIKQTTISEPRLSEIVENYRDMGYEVAVVEHPVLDSDDGCNTCFLGDVKAGKLVGDIYIRRIGTIKSLEDELF